MIDTTFIDLTLLLSFFFFNDTATTEIYTLSLHDALPISQREGFAQLAHAYGDLVFRQRVGQRLRGACGIGAGADRKSTRLNSSHSSISYAVFCLKKKKILMLIYILTQHMITYCTVTILLF